MSEPATRRTAAAFGAAIGLGAFLLFLVQPVVGRLVLPRFGGAASAWLACLMFFQVTLVVGYAYAHLVQTWPLRVQGWLHLGLLAGAAAALPLFAAPAPLPPVAPDPAGGSAGQVLLSLARQVGLPYGVLAATGPLLQRWYVAQSAGSSPYRLYALSNAASLGALASYPVVIEPLLGLSRQVRVWAVLFGVFALLTGWHAVRVMRTPRMPAQAAPPRGEDQPLRAGQVALWVVLAGTGSAVLMATTNQLTQDVTGVPFVWLAPLALYLLTFVVCFDHARWYNRRVFLPLLACVVPLAVAALVVGTRAAFWMQLLVFGGTLTVCCMVCHGELVRLAPPPGRLTGFYLAVAIGGALGGVLVAVVAPLVFRGFWELHVSLAACCLLVLVTTLDPRQDAPLPGFSLAALGGVVVALVTVLAGVVLLQFSWDTGVEVVAWTTVRSQVLELSFLYREYLVLGAASAFVAAVGLTGDWLNARAGMPSRWYAYALPAAVLAVPAALLMHMREFSRRSVHMERNFYGVLRVMEWRGNAETGGSYRELVHGQINHGLQYLTPERAAAPTTYYGRETGVALALEHRQRAAAAAGVRIGAVGLGAGTLAAYGQPGDLFRFYEIDPSVVRLAATYFTYLEDSPAAIEIGLGDARLEMERELRAQGNGRGRFDVIAVDAFLGDAIPVHLLTREAMAVYLRHLEDDGLLALHVSNRLLDLRPLTRGLAATFGLRAALFRSAGRRGDGTFDATWVVLARPDNAFFADPPVAAAITPWPASVDQRATVWTDDYSSVWRLLRRSDGSGEPAPAASGAPQGPREGLRQPPR
ncbi:MAG TPA: fused MFS/spermidine synthase [Gemmatimonadales bacterium]|nr:fused MFS/spermidine synthase [Gemmatimonadales bacterium]